MNLAERLLALSEALTTGAVPHAFGGAIALAYALDEPRATRDLDVNVFLDVHSAVDVLDVLPDGVSRGSDELEQLVRDDQVRLWWDATPVDLFFAAHSFHHEVATRCLTVPFLGQEIRVLAPTDLATFKVLFDRTKDWLDLRLMWESGTLDIPLVARQVTDLVGDDPRVGRLHGVPRGS